MINSEKGLLRTQMYKIQFYEVHIAVTAIIDNPKEWTLLNQDTVTTPSEDAYH